MFLRLRIHTTWATPLRSLAAASPPPVPRHTLTSRHRGKLHKPDPGSTTARTFPHMSEARTSENVCEVEHLKVSGLVPAYGQRCQVPSFVQYQFQAGSYIPATPFTSVPVVVLGCDVGVVRVVVVVVVHF